MITALDTNVLIDLFRDDAEHHEQSRNWIRSAFDAGAILVCDVVYAELVPLFRSRSTLNQALQGMGATPAPLSSNAAYEAGVRWARYRAAGGPRERIITDFLIGAHALQAADTFLTRDRGFFSSYFPELRGAEAFQR